MITPRLFLVYTQFERIGRWDGRRGVDWGGVVGRRARWGMGGEGWAGAGGFGRFGGLSGGGSVCGPKKKRAAEGIAYPLARFGGWQIGAVLLRHDGRSDSRISAQCLGPMGGPPLPRLFWGRGGRWGGMGIDLVGLRRPCSSGRNNSNPATRLRSAHGHQVRSKEWRRAAVCPASV